MPDTNISPTGDQPISDTTSDTNQPVTGADAQVPPTDQQPDDQQTPPAASGPQQQQQPQGQPDQGQPGENPEAAGKPDLSKPNGPQAPAAAAPSVQDHPAVQKASLLHTVAQTLAGGPRYTESIDVNTGKMERKQIPLSKGDIGMAIAMEAITGALSGLSQHGPGALGKAAAAGFDTVAQQQKEAQQQQDQQANADYTRHAQVFENNLRMMQMAQAMGTKDYEQVQQFAGQYKGTYDKLVEDYPQYIKGTGGEQDAAKYHSTKEAGMPTGNVIPVYDPKTGKQSVGPAGNKLWQMEYAFIDPSFKADNMLGEDDLALAKKYHVPGLVNSNGTPISAISTTPLGMSMVLNIKHQLVAAQLGDQALQEYHAKMGTKDAPSFADEVSKDPTLLKAMDKFQPLLMAAKGDIGKAIGELAAGGQGRQPNPNAAGKIMNLYGGSGMVQQYDQKVLLEKDVQKKTAEKRAAYDGALNTQTAESIMADKEATPEQKERAQTFLKTDSHREISTAVAKAGAEATARTQAEINVKKANGIPLFGGKGGATEDDAALLDPKLAPLVQDAGNYNTPTGTNEKFLAALNQTDPGLASMVKAYSNGMDVQSYYAAVKRFGAKVNAAIHAYDPSFNASMMRAYDKTMQENSAAGKMGKTNAAASTAIEHLGALYHAYGLKAASGLSGDYDTSLNQASTETASMYANGNKPGEDEIKHTREALDHPVNANKGRQAAIKTAKEAMDKIEENFNQYDKDLPSGIKRVGPLSPKAAKAYQEMTGEKVDPKLVNWGAGGKGVHNATVAPQQSQTPQFSHVSASGKFGWDGAKWVPIPGK
jgi:hypothetical protein